MMSRGILAFVLGVAPLVACSNEGSSAPGGDSPSTTDTTASSATASTSATAAASTTATTSTSSATTSSTAGAGSGGQGGSRATGVGGAGTDAAGVGGAGAGTGGATASTVSGGTGGMLAFTLGSTAFSEGTAIPVKYTCKGGAQGNISPDLTWTAGPAGTLSYAVVLTDKTNMLVHWAIWDIPSTVTSLPENLEKAPNPAAPAGSKQTLTPQGNASGYYGPCPPNEHTYEFTVHALDVAMLPNVTTNSMGAAVAPEVAKHTLASVSLTGTFTP
jgi:Raf kinase inhibitor-like YbhB/YbcL family protein